MVVCDIGLPTFGLWRLVFPLETFYILWPVTDPCSSDFSLPIVRDLYSLLRRSWDIDGRLIMFDL